MQSVKASQEPCKLTAVHANEIRRPAHQLYEGTKALHAVPSARSSNNTDRGNVLR